MRPTKPGGKSGFPAGTESEFQSTRVYRQVSPKDDPKPPAADNEAVTVRPKSEPLSPCLFAGVEGPAQVFEREAGGVRGRAPDVNLIALEGEVPRREGPYLV